MALHPLYRLGAIPEQGYRSLLAFWSGGASVGVAPSTNLHGRLIRRSVVRGKGVLYGPDGLSVRNLEELRRKLEEFAQAKSAQAQEAAVDAADDAGLHSVAERVEELRLGSATLVSQVGEIVRRIEEFEREQEEELEMVLSFLA